MYIKIINYLFWWIVASAETWRQTNPWLSPQSLPFKATTNFQRLHRKTPPKQCTPLTRPWTARRGSVKNCRASQVQLWCKFRTCTKASAIHFANLRERERERWSSRTCKSEQDKSPARKCDREEVRDLQEQSRRDNHCESQEWWDVNTVITCHGWGDIKVGDEWARRTKAA